MYLRIPDKTKGWDRAKESVVYIILLSCIFWLRCGWWLHRLAALVYDQISSVGGTSYTYRKSPKSSPKGPTETWPADGLGSRPGGPSKPPCSDQVACQKSRWSFESPWRQDILQHLLHQNQAQDRLMGRVSVQKKNILKSNGGSSVFKRADRSVLHVRQIWWWVRRWNLMQTFHSCTTAKKVDRDAGGSFLDLAYAL